MTWKRLDGDATITPPDLAAHGYAPHDLEEFNSDFDPAPMALPPEPQGRTRGRRILDALMGFLLGQGAVQGLNILAGMFLVRYLSIETYAQFGLATGFQTVFSVLMDLGFASTIVPLVGERRDDRALIGRYVRSAKHLRDRSFLYLTPVASLAFLAITRRHHWTWTIQLLLLGSVLLSLYSGGKVSYFSAPLFVFGRLREYYVPQAITGGGRFLAYIALQLVGGLNAWTASICNALNITANGSLIRRASQRYLQWPARNNAATDREMLKYILPASPAIVFSAFQSQISLFLISIFGGTRNIAEVTALSRIGQLFAVLMTFNMVIVEPYIARHKRQGLLRTFLLLLLLASVACMPLILLGFWQPMVYVWVIGTKYESLSSVMGWYLLSSSISFVAGLLWIMNRGRKWVFWSGSIVEVTLLLTAQIAFLLIVGVRTTREAVIFGLASSLCAFTSHAYVAIVGFAKGSRTSGTSSVQSV